MKKTTNPSPNTGEVKSRPALTPEARENQLIALAVDLVEQRLRNGTASSQEVTHFLKLGSSKSREEKDLLRAQVKLAEAKVEALHANADIRGLLKEAMDAFKCYSGQDGDNEQHQDIF